MLNNVTLFLNNGLVTLGNFNEQKEGKKEKKSEAFLEKKTLYFGDAD